MTVLSHSLTCWRFMWSDNKMIEVITKSEAPLDLGASNSSMCSVESKLCLPLHEKDHQSEPKKDSKQTPADPILLHPLLLHVPMGIRYGFAGLLANAIFIVFYQQSMHVLEPKLAASTIYSIVYFFFIPINHFILTIFVFGWPASYVSSLANNYTVGFSAIMLGGGCTAYLDKIEFEVKADVWIRDHITGQISDGSDDFTEGTEFYTSLLVLFISGIWSYCLLLIFNIPASKPEKKEQ